MNETNYTLAFDADFITGLTKSQEEAKRLGLKEIPTIIVLKTLLETEDSYLYEFFNLTHAKWGKVKNSMQEHVKKYVAEKHEEEGSILTMTFDEKVLQFKMSEDLYCSVIEAGSITENKVVDEVTFIFSMLSRDIEKQVVNFFRDVKRDMTAVLLYFQGILFNSVLTDSQVYQQMLTENEQEYDEQDYQKSNVTVVTEDGLKIPKVIEKSVTLLKCNEQDALILGREEETQKLMKILLKCQKKNAILVGKPGVGKTAIVEHLVYKIARGECPNELKNKKVLSLDVNSLIAGTTLRGMAEERFAKLVEFLEKESDVILFVDEIHNMIGAGTQVDDTHDLANSLKPILARENISVIGCTTEQEYKRIFEKDKAFKRRFETVEVKEPSFDEVYPMIKAQIERLKSFHSVEIKKKTVEYIIMMAACFNFETCNPDRTLDLIDKAMATAKMQGKKEVTREVVINNFESNFKLFNKLPKDQKFSTAYHEAGHYLVNRYSKNRRKLLAISCIPAEDYLGVTVYDSNEDELLYWDNNACIENIALDLGGRIAEKMYTDSYSIGARSDLKNATNMARDMVVKYGLTTKFSKRNVERNVSENMKNEINTEVDQIIDEAHKLATQILREHKNVLKSLATELYKKGILIGKEVEKICHEEEEKTKWKQEENVKNP
ncbi:MAG: AAA family ATPase [Clostridia bacterium]